MDLFELHRVDEIPLCQIEFVMVGIPEPHDIDSSTSGYTFPQETSSPSCRILASGWIDNCMQKHSKCSADKIQWLPTHLVDVELDNSIIKLVETQKLSKNSYPPYFALSHRWGASSDQSILLLSGNRLALMEHIPIDKLTASL
ncbi:hypothetical protein OCU04_011859 [Sclerotinia nivalis]|uniref:Heterokaryon incompatibility domain-containing protein n=1 Tax=Sclerotinia nivalis TaxID=352851 RepID=A0A9X0DDU2_9HELO|nr:hypothetical protein OCU04_011859 [Sclerotinia nivalis]